MTNKAMVKILQVLYIIVFIFSIVLIIATHTVPAPALAVFRIPTNLREVGPQLGLVWPTSLDVYHVFLVLFFTVLLLNGIGLYRLYIPKWISICRISSFFGLFLAWSIFIFFMLPLILNINLDTKNLQTSLIYSLLSFGFLIVNLLTFAVAKEKRK